MEIKCPECDGAMRVTKGEASPWIIHCDKCNHHWPWFDLNGGPDGRYIIKVKAVHNKYTGKNTITVTCPFCGRNHEHSWRQETCPGWRDAHCSGIRWRFDMRLKEGGYAFECDPNIPEDARSYFIYTVEEEPIKEGNNG